jgi:hypothetical protein
MVVQVGASTLSNLPRPVFVGHFNQHGVAFTTVTGIPPDSPVFEAGVSFDTQVFDTSPVPVNRYLKRAQVVVDNSDVFHAGIRTIEMTKKDADGRTGNTYVPEDVIDHFHIVHTGVVIGGVVSDVESNTSKIPSVMVNISDRIAVDGHVAHEVFGNHTTGTDWHDNRLALVGTGPDFIAGNGGPFAAGQVHPDAGTDNAVLFDDEPGLSAFDGVAFPLVIGSEQNNA